MRRRAKSVLFNSAGEVDTGESGGDDSDSPSTSRVGSSYSKQLEQSKHDVGQVINAAALKLDGGEFGEPFLDWLGHSIFTLLSGLSDRHQTTAREHMKAQSAAFDMKIAHSRTSAKMLLQNQAAEMESALNRKLEERLIEMMGEGAANALADANREREEAQRELAELRVKCVGIEESLQMTQQLLRASEAQVTALQEAAASEQQRVGALEADVANCQVMLDQALADLDIKGQENQTLQEKLAAIVGQLENKHANLNALKQELDQALVDLCAAPFPCTFVAPAPTHLRLPPRSTRRSPLNPCLTRHPKLVNTRPAHTRTRAHTHTHARTHARTY